MKYEDTDLGRDGKALSSRFWKIMGGKRTLSKNHFKFCVSL